MFITRRALIAGTAFSGLTLFWGISQTVAKDREADIGALWREPTDIASRDLIYGQGGKEHAPTSGPFVFSKEDPDGNSPKFVVKDSQGVKWKVKLGEEVRPETAATR
ncbi:MAG: hypothetical protein ABI995_05700, partial [Acidobacteriota bacterium]